MSWLDVTGGLPKRAGERSPIARSATFLIANQGLVSGLGFVFWILAARNYPSVAVGQATTVIAAAVFLSVLSTMGLPYALVRGLPSSPNPASLVKTILRASTATALVVATLAVLILPQLSGDFSFLGGDLLYGAMLVALVALWSVEMSVEQVLVAARRTELSTAMLAVFALLRLPFPLLGSHVLSRDLLAGWVVGMGVGVGLAIVFFVPAALRAMAGRQSGPKERLSALVRYGAANHVGNLLSISAPMLLPLVIIQALGGAAGVRTAAQFYVAFSFAQLLYVVPAATSLAQFAEGARPETDFHGDRRRALLLAFGIGAPGAVAMALLAGPFLSIFGAEYAAGGTGMLVGLALATLVIIPETIFATQHRLAGDLRPIMLASGLASAVVLGATILLLRSSGPEVIGWSFLAGHALAAGVIVSWPARPVRTPPKVEAPVQPPSDFAGAPMTAPRAVVMILNWNAGDYLKRCVESVVRTVPADVRIVVLDNGSKDGSLEAATDGHPRVEVHRFGANLGFCGAYNRGIRAANEEFVILLNPDTVADRAEWVESLVAAADRDPSVAVVAGALVFADDPSRINSVGGRVYWWTGPVDIGFGEPDRGQYGAEFRPFSGCGGNMLVRRQVFVDLGGFDEQMFAFIEDVDFCWRVRLQGMKVSFAPEAVVKHKFSALVGGMSPLKVYLTNRNFLRAMLRNYRASTLVVALPAYGLWTSAKIVGGLFIERSPTLVAAVLRSVGWNVRFLGDTLKTRRTIQAARVLGDREIRASMGPQGFEPWASVRNRLAISSGRLGEIQT